MFNLDQALQNAHVVGISGHIRPDGDCTGSTLALYNYIKLYFPEIQVQLFLEQIPDVFHFLSRSKEIQNEYPQGLVFDTFFALDCGDTGRLGNAEDYFLHAKRTFCIDHHISNTSYAQENYIVPDASSTCELVFDLMEPEKITKEIAECLYTGIVHDTGVFQYSCTSAKTMNIAGILMEKGIDYSKIVDETFYTKTHIQNQVLGYVLLNSKLYLDDKCIIGTLTKQDMAKFGVTSRDLEGIVNQLRVTKDTVVAVFMYEVGEDEFKVSLRGNSNIDLASFAVLFGGGGHAKAAGFNRKGKKETVIQDVLEEFECVFAKQNGQE